MGTRPGTRESVFRVGAGGFTTAVLYRQLRPMSPTLLLWIPMPFSFKFDGERGSPGTCPTRLDLRSTQGRKERVCRVGPVWDQGCEGSGPLAWKVVRVSVPNG